MNQFREYPGRLGKAVDLFHRKARRQLTRLEKECDQVQDFGNPTSNNPFLYREMCEFAMVCETFIHQIRRLVHTQTFTLTNCNVLQEPVAVHKLAPVATLTFSDGCLFVRMPPLSRLKTDYSYSVTEILSSQLMDFRMERLRLGEDICFPTCGMIFIHHTDNETICGNLLSDYDNMERSSIVNAFQVSGYMTDNPLRFAEMNVTVLDESAYTEIILCQGEEFAKLICRLDYSLYMLEGADELT